MQPFAVYDLYPIKLVRADNFTVFDHEGREYLDFYGGHAVISIGHARAEYVEALTRQLRLIAFYSNVVQNDKQDELAEKLGKLSGYPDYALFLCNSGAEANENALKLASTLKKGRKLISFGGSFHGRTAAAAAATDNPKFGLPLITSDAILRLPLNDITAFENALKKEGDEVFAVIIEGIQGVGGVQIPDDEFLSGVSKLCQSYKIPLVLDEIQSGCMRTGDYFAHSRSGIRPSLITVAKGIGNGFPVAGVLVGPEFTPVVGSLGTTFGGNYLACAAGVAVCDVILKDELGKNAVELGEYLTSALRAIKAITEVRGRGLMIGFDLDSRFSAKEIRRELLFKYGIFVGSAGNPQTIRLLPPLTITQAACQTLIDALRELLTA